MGDADLKMKNPGRSASGEISSFWIYQNPGDYVQKRYQKTVLR